MLIIVLIIKKYIVQVKYLFYTDIFLAIILKILTQ